MAIAPPAVERLLLQTPAQVPRRPALGGGGWVFVDVGGVLVPGGGAALVVLPPPLPEQAVSVSRREIRA